MMIAKPFIFKNIVLYKYFRDMMKYLVYNCIGKLFNQQLCTNNFLIVLMLSSIYIQTIVFISPSFHACTEILNIFYTKNSCNSLICINGICTYLKISGKCYFNKYFTQILNPIFYASKEALLLVQLNYSSAYKKVYVFLIGRANNDLRLF